MDSLGNWAGNSVDGTSYSSNYDNQNQITGTDSVPYPPGYDNNGNTLYDQNGGYTYDAWNRIVCYVTGGEYAPTFYSYDADGRLISSTPYYEPTNDIYYDSQWQDIQEGSGSTAVEQYVWGVGNINQVVLCDSAAYPSDGGNLGISGSGLSNRAYYQQDANDDVTATIDASGNVIQRFTYDPYGNSTTGSPEIGFQGGQQLPGDSFLYVFRNRAYNVLLGRWMQQDPAGYVNGMNAYQFVESNPIAFSDPAGLWELGINFGAGGVIPTMGGDAGVTLWIGVNPDTGTIGIGATAGYEGGEGFGAGISELGLGGSFSTDNPAEGNGVHGSTSASTGFAGMAGGFSGGVSQDNENGSFTGGGGGKVRFGAGAGGYIANGHSATGSLSYNPINLWLKLFKGLDALGNAASSVGQAEADTPPIPTS